MSQGGWFAVSRRVFEDADVREGALCPLSAWLHLVSLANYADNPDHDPPLRRGSLFTSAGKLRKAWRWESSSKVNARLEKWQRRGLISRVSHGRGTVVTITGFERWQSASAYDESTTVLRRKYDGFTTDPRRSEPATIDVSEESTTEVRRKCDGSTTEVRRFYDATTKQGTIDKGTTDKGSNSLPVVESLPDATASSAPTAPDLTTKAGRERHWPIASKLPTSDGGRAQYPAEFVAFRAAYPNAVKRAPSKLTYAAWRKLVISGVEPDTLRAAAERYAKDIGGPKFARRCHGPNGWLAGDEWREYAGGAHRDNPTAPQETDNRTDAERLSAHFGGLRLQVEMATDEEMENLDW